MRRTSKKRTAVLEAVRSGRDHPTAQDVWLKLHSEVPGLSLATVYRNLNEYADKGEIRRLDGFGGQSRFDGDMSPHAHFTCSKCGAVIDVKLDVPPEYDEKTEISLGGKVFGHELTFFGVCADCEARDK